jgi:hypothetical protein
MDLVERYVVKYIFVLLLNNPVKEFVYGAFKSQMRDKT